MSEHIKLTDYKNLVSLLSVPLLPVCNLRKSPLPLILGAEGQISRRSVPLLPELRSSLRSDLSLCSQKRIINHRLRTVPLHSELKKIAASRRSVPLLSTNITKKNRRGDLSLCSQIIIIKIAACPSTLN